MKFINVNPKPKADKVAATVQHILEEYNRSPAMGSETMSLTFSFPFSDRLLNRFSQEKTTAAQFKTSGRCAYNLDVNHDETSKDGVKSATATVSFHIGDKGAVADDLAFVLGLDKFEFFDPIQGNCLRLTYDEGKVVEIEPTHYVTMGRYSRYDFLFSMLSESDAVWLLRFWLTRNDSILMLDDYFKDYISHSERSEVFLNVCKGLGYICPVRAQEMLVASKRYSETIDNLFRG